MNVTASTASARDSWPCSTPRASSGKRVLDVGCGWGRLSLVLAPTRPSTSSGSIAIAALIARWPRARRGGRAFQRRVPRSGRRARGVRSLAARPRHRAPLRLRRHRRAGRPRAARPAAASRWSRSTSTSGARPARSRASPTTRRGWRRRSGAPASRPRSIEVEREVERFASVEEGLAAAVGLRGQVEERRALVPLSALSRRGRPHADAQPSDRQGPKVVTLVVRCAHRDRQGARARARLRSRRDRARRAARARAGAQALDRGRLCGHHGLPRAPPRGAARPARVLPGAAPSSASRSTTTRASRADPSWAPVARYAWGRDYHDVIAPRLDRLGAYLEEACGARSKGYVDTGPVLERDLAARAGLGWIGKNTMLLRPDLGSWFFIGVLLTTAELERDAPLAGSLRLVPRLSRRLPDRGLRRALRARRAPVHLVPHDRASRRDRAELGSRDRRVAVRLRRLPERRARGIARRP